jgi:hypothetical protein
MAWREGGDWKVLERMVRESRFVKKLEIDSSHSGEMRTFTKRPMRLPQLLIDSSAFQINAHRLGTLSQATYLHPLLAILNLDRLIVPSVDVPLHLPHTPLLVAVNDSCGFRAYRAVFCVFDFLREAAADWLLGHRITNGGC